MQTTSSPERLAGTTDDAPAGPDPLGPGEPTFDEALYPARPRALRPVGRVRARADMPAIGDPVAANPAYVAWLESQSMLGDARTLAVQFAGQGIMLQKSYANPEPREAIRTASVWLTAYPI